MMMKMMKNPIILVTCVLLFSSLAVLALENAFGPDECCFQFVASHLPKKRVLGYEFTDQRCSKKAVIFTMKNNAKLCANPHERWVQDIIKAKGEVRDRKLNSAASK